MNQLLLQLEKKAKCHPERKHSAKGLCKKCYAHQYHQRPHVKEKANAWRRKYWHTHPEYQTKAKEVSRQWALKNPDKRRDIYRSHHLRKKYGITLKESRELFEANGGYCWICGETPAEGIDHCHKTGTVRGALCRPCNLGIGHLDDNFELVLKAAQYLKTGKVVTPYEQTN